MASRRIYVTVMVDIDNEELDEIKNQTNFTAWLKRRKNKTAAGAIFDIRIKTP